MEDKSILNINTRNKRLLIRADLNVPINNNKISDETRIERFCNGISKLLKKNAKIIISHIWEDLKVKKTYHFLIEYF